MDNDTERLLNDFFAAAAEFILIVDSADSVPRDEFLECISYSLAAIYCCALKLPAVAPDTDGVVESSFKTTEWSKLDRAIREKLGSHDSYWNVFDSSADEPAIQRTLAGDISEIYVDIQGTLTLKTKARSRADLMWDLRHSFRTHWGKHLLSALIAIYDQHLE